MRRIYATGETVFDIMFRNGRPEGGNPGGSVLNSAVSLGRLGLRPVFMSDFCNDMIGMEIRHFLEENGVEARQVISDTDMQTSVALAFLDENSNAKYEFYKQRPQQPDLALFSADFRPDDILLFGSFYGIMPEIRAGISHLIRQARQNGAIVVYDPNFRRPHLKDLPRVKGFIEENISLSHIIKGSDEDFGLIFGADTAAEAYGRVRAINPDAMMFYTKGKDGCEYFHNGESRSWSVPKIVPISTIGAGDNFNAGIVHGLILNEIMAADLLGGGISCHKIDDIVDHAVQYSQMCCMSQENYISCRCRKS
ncbi:MAG: PfkB family carbohydrate kinase [Bacteroidales bacterium]|nr:PfkB family carbohydrate kinase [Bacteroidales bacterium]